LHDRIEEVANAFSRAEEEIKKVEDLAGEVAIPAINELRYAGYHVLQALSGNSEDQDEQFRRAKRHCERAQYDASDMGVVYLLEKIKIFVDDYKDIAITDVLPDYVGMRSKLEEINDRRADALKNSDNRNGFYESAAGDLGELSDIALNFDLAREELNKKIVDRNRVVFRT
jgi:hypothetical protein